MTKSLSTSANKVQEALNQLGSNLRVVELPDSTRTAPEAAKAIGCEVGQIVKSLVFKGKASGSPIMVIVSGGNRVDEQKLAQIVNEEVEKADADYVRLCTGFAIGGIPPVGLAEKMLTIIDEDLLKFSEVWAAAGTPHAVFPLSPSDLPRMIGGNVHDIKKKV